MITPLTLDRVFPSGTFVAPRLPDEGAKWISSDRHTIEFMTSGLLACAGDCPVLVHKSAMSPQGLAVMKECGVEVGAAIEVYETPQQYQAALQRRFEDGETAAYIYPAGRDRSGREAALVGSQCLEYLNNKRNIEQLAGSENVPQSAMVDIRDPVEIRSLTLPVVLKVATNEPNGGGAEVAICRRPRHLRRAAMRFSEAETVIAQEFIDAQESWCIQFAVLPDGAVRDIGASEQICTRNGMHAGNLFTVGRTPGSSALAVARAIAEKGSKLGFRGLCGLDILVGKRGKPFAIDLNFRPVTSSSFVYEASRRMNGSGNMRHARFAFCLFAGSLRELIRCCRDGFREDWLIPLATFDPDYGKLGPGPARLRLMILAGDMKTLRHREKLLASRGIEFARMPSNTWRGFGRRLRAMLRHG